MQQMLNIDSLICPLQSYIFTANQINVSLPEVINGCHFFAFLSDVKDCELHQNNDTFWWRIEPVYRIYIYINFYITIIMKLNEASFLFEYQLNTRQTKV